MYKTLANILLATLACMTFTVNAQNANAIGEEPRSDEAVADDPFATNNTETDLAEKASPVVTCSHNNLIRQVEVVYENPDQVVPCSVHYRKETEAPGETKTLWSAQSQEGYCEERAAGLVAKLEGSGWDCESGAQ